MRLVFLLSALPLALALPARAQVTLDLHALDQGQPQAQPAPEKRPPAGRKPAQRKPAEQAKASPVTPKPAPKPSAPMPAIPAAPPPEVSLAPIVVQPAAKPEQAAPPPISPSAGGAVEPIQGGLRVLFSPERTDLTQGTEDAIKAYLASVPKTAGTSFNVTAYAAGPPEDPSTPRRLSLSRALAIRSVMMADGIDSPRIYVRALGASAAGGPPDRVDIAALGTNAPGSQTPAAAGQPK